MLEKYSNEAMKRINMILGEGHRVKPYDLTKTADLKQALQTTVAAFMDYYHYRVSLDDLSENYDESLEYCETAAWLDLENAPDRVDDLIVEGFSVLAAASDVFEKLTERAKMNCAKVIKAILTAPPATQRMVFGREYQIEPQGMDAKIEELFSMIGEVEYHQAMPDNLKTFLSLMEEQWEVHHDEQV